MYTLETVTSDNVLYIAKEVEKEGLDSVWVLERLLLLLKPQTPYAATPDGSFPAEYQNVLDPLETLTYLAGNTRHISLFMITCLWKKKKNIKLMRVLL